MALVVLLLLVSLPQPLAPAFQAQGQNAPPTAVISSPLDGQEFLVGQLVTFDGSQSEDEDPDNLTYLWNLGGQVISGSDKAIIQRAFTTSGPLLVILTVTDKGGRNDTDFINIKIRALNAPPVAVISTPLDGQAFLGGKSINFDGRESYDPDGGTLVYRWETNRTIDPIGTTARFSIRLPLGRYRVTLFVYDQVGSEGSMVINISVEVNVPPALSGGSVDPLTGPNDLPGGYNFSVTYRDDDNDPPSEIRVKVGPPGNLVPYDLVPVDPDDQDYRDGNRFYTLVPLDNGQHSYIFTCRDLFYTCATALYQGPLVYRIEEIGEQSLGATVTVNWTSTGQVSLRAVAPPGIGPADTVIMSSTVRVVVLDGVWTWARLRLDYSFDYIVEEGTITLLWYDSLRGLWVPASSQRHDTGNGTVEGLVPGDDAVMAVFGVIAPGQENRPPNLVIRYDIKDAYVNKVLWFDASCSTDPDGTADFFYWDFVDDGKPGPWVPGVQAHTVFEETGTYRVGLMAIDDGNVHYLYENVSIRSKEEYAPGPWDNPGILFLLASLLVIAFGLAVAYRLHKPRTYDDLFGKAYRPVEADEYSQLFRKLTEEELRGDLDIEEDTEGEQTEEEGTEERTEEEQAEEGGTEEGSPEAGPTHEDRVEKETPEGTGDALEGPDRDEGVNEEEEPD